MFMRIQRKTTKSGRERLYASLVENRREGTRTVQRTVAYLGPVTAEQAEFLKAAYAKNKPRLVWDGPHRRQ
jgi:hypothetical protein